MSKLWDALKKAEKESSEEIVASYEENFAETPQELAGDLTMNIVPGITEEFRKLHSSLIRKGRKSGKEIAIVAITSSNIGEGCSTIAVSLAASTAADKKESKVLLVDANLRMPGVHSLFDLPVDPGLIDAVQDYDKRMEYFRASPVQFVPNLHILPAGDIDKLRDNPLEIIESENFEKLMQEMKSFYDLVVIDCPPVNPYSDALALSHFVDGFLLVIDSQNTRWEVARRAERQLANAEANILGAIINRRKLHIPKSVYKRL